MEYGIERVLTHIFGEPPTDEEIQAVIDDIREMDAGEACDGVCESCTDEIEGA